MPYSQVSSRILVDRHQELLIFQGQYGQTFHLYVAASSTMEQRAAQIASTVAMLDRKEAELEAYAAAAGAVLKDVPIVSSSGL